MKSILLVLSLGLSLSGDGNSFAADSSGATPAVVVEKASEAPPTVTFLGVEPMRVGPALAAQLKLEEGVGLSVLAVIPGSPAEQAKIQKYDILLKLDDQILTHARQLGTLVRRKQPGERVTLTLLRAGTEIAVPVTLQGRPQRPESRQGRWRYHRDAGGEHPELTPVAEPEDDWREEVSVAVREAMRSAGEGSREAAQAVRKAVRQAHEAMRNITILKLNRGNLVYADEDGQSLELRSQDGNRVLIAKDKSGKVVFEGPIQTPEQRQAIPAEVRARLEKLESEIEVDWHAPLPPPAVAPTAPVPPSPPAPPPPPPLDAAEEAA